MQWRINLDKFIHLWDALEKNDLGQAAVTISCKGKILFPLLQFLVTLMRPNSPPHSLQSLEMESSVSDIRWQWVRIFIKISAPGYLSLVSGWEKKVKYYFSFPVPVPNPDWQQKNICNKHIFELSHEFLFWYLIVVETSSFRDSYCPHVCLILCPENLALQLSGWKPSNMARQKCEFTNICH